MLGIAIYFGIQAYHSWLRTTEAQNTADKALAEYIRAVEETYGTDQSKWPQCVQETVKYSQTHPLIRILQYGTTEMLTILITRVY
jgi:hypothetical protein